MGTEISTAAVRCSVCQDAFPLPGVVDLASVREGHVVLFGAVLECPSGHEAPYESDDVVAWEG